jgi:type III pantothenate kinase
MILTIDIGNTNISCACFRGAKMVFSCRVSHAQWKTAGARSLLGARTDIEKVFISSVVPRLSRYIKRELARSLNAAVFIVNEDLFVRLPDKKRAECARLGADRLSALYGSLFLYTAPFLIVDCGTAITFDIVDEREVYQGGLIVPGISLSFAALKKAGALLPKDVMLSRPKIFPAHGTPQALVAGSIYGFSALVDGLIERFQKRYGSAVGVILTGGDAARIKPYLKKKVFHEPHLIHRSLLIISKLFAEGNI